jgi:triacylglycerol esterase/lipase EstA (alpha/beta hydrolase family)
MDIHEGAQQLKYKVVDMLLRTGAEKVNLIAHSQGGITVTSSNTSGWHRMALSTAASGRPWRTRR